MIYFISDLHFGHEGILRLERDQFKNIKEHDEYIIEKINKQVKVTDELWILGDVGAPEKLKFINGRKHLILGNHDKRSVKEYEGYVATVHTAPLYFNNRVLLSHHPHPVPSGVLNIHGHLHGATLDSKNHINLSINDVDYKVFSEKDMQRAVQKIPLPNDRFLEEWYAELYIFKNNDDVITDTSGKIKLEETIKLRKSKYWFF